MPWLHDSSMSEVLPLVHRWVSWNSHAIKDVADLSHLILVLSRREKAAADELSSKAGYEGFCIQGQLLHSLESAVDRAAAAHSDKEQ